MSQLGVGAMIAMLGGNESSAKTFQSVIGKTISDLKIVDNRLVFTFDDLKKVALFDDAQSCCEHRYMHTDDELSHYVGSVLQAAETREGPSEDRGGDPKDSEFLIVTTSKGQFTVVNYNEHNGYYGGFAIRAVEVA